MKKKKSIDSSNEILSKNNRCSLEIIVCGRSNVGKSSLAKLITHRKLVTGKRPGVTIKPTYIYVSDILITDLPGFGFMKGVSNEKIDMVKDEIIKYIELNKNRIKVAIYVTDIKSFDQIVNRWIERSEIPIDLEFCSFLLECNIFLVIVLNKSDKININELSSKIKNIENIYFTYFNSVNIDSNDRCFIVSSSSKNNDILNVTNKIKYLINKLKRDDL